MSRTRSALLTIAAAVAAFAFAIPATASAAYWTDYAEEGPLQNPSEISFAGTVSWQGHTGAGIHCEVNGEAALHPGNGGNIETLYLEGCGGYGSFANCEPVSSTASAPWPIAATDQKDIVTGAAEWKFTYIHSWFCGLKEVRFVFYPLEMTLTPDNPLAMSILHMQGDAMISINGSSEFENEVTGEVEVYPTEGYGIEAG